MWIENAIHQVQLNLFQAHIKNNRKKKKSRHYYISKNMAQAKYKPVLKKYHDRF